MRLRSSIYWVALIILFAASLSAQAGTVALSVYTEATGDCPGGGSYVCVGCTFKVIATASDCDEWDSLCCWDDLEFPDWPEEVSEPARQADGSYYSETIVTCNSVGPTTYTFSANDLVHCTNQENDSPAEQTITVTGVEIVELTGPADPICPGTNVEFHVTMSPNNIGASLLTWTGGENGEVSPYDPHVYHADFNTPGTHQVSAACGENGMTVDVVVQAPFHEVAFLEPVGVTGGIVPVRVQVRTRCAGLVGDVWWDKMLIQRENPDDPYCEDGWCPLEGGWPTWLESSEPDQDGIYTSIYTTYWDHTLILKNGTYHLRAKGSFTVAPDYETEIPFEVPLTVEVKNLAFTSADPEGVVVWKGEEFEDETLTVHLEDNDLSDPLTLSFSFYSTARDNSMGESVYDVIGITKEFPDGLPGGSYTLHLNSDEWTADPGLYTFQVEATQTDICNTDPYLQITDGDIRYRSEHLHVFRGVDAMGPVYEAEYYGYDDKGTPEEVDDDFLYYIRLYRVSASDPICGSEGEVWLYDPTLTKVYSCGLGALECLLHPSPDGLCSGYHAIVIPVPASLFQYAGMYRFVLHVKDDHHDLYRNGMNRWALDLNAGKIANGAAAWSTAGTRWLENTHGLAKTMIETVAKVSTNPWDMIHGKARPGYLPFPPPGNPGKGGSGQLKDVSAKLTIRTLNRLCPEDAQANPALIKFCTKNGVWAFYGHGNDLLAQIDMSTDTFLGAGIHVQSEMPYNQWYKISNFDLSHVRVAFLACCYSAGGGTFTGDSIAEAFTKIPGGKGARSAVGFEGKVRLTNPIFCQFNGEFWAYLAWYECTVQEAISKSMGPVQRRTPLLGFAPVLFGDTSTKLYPPP